MKTIQDILKLFQLEQLDIDLFRGFSPKDAGDRVFGGQVVAQALAAANDTVSERKAHSLKSDFLRPGDPTIPIIYEVDRIRDGKSFTTRRVLAKQRGKAIYSMSVSYQVFEQGLEHAFEMPKVPGPDEAPDPAILYESLKGKISDDILPWYAPNQAIQRRALEPVNPLQRRPRPPHYAMWVRSRDPMDDDVTMHQCLFGYVSDMNLLSTATLPHSDKAHWIDPHFQSASLDHCIWFHREFRMDDWILITQDSPAAAGGRGFCRAQAYSQDGKILASISQEALIRLHPKK